MSTASELESALLTILPPDYHEHVPALARLLADAVGGALSPKEFHAQLTEATLARLLKALGGRRVEVGQQLFTFSYHEREEDVDDSAAAAAPRTDSGSLKVIIAGGERSVAADTIGGDAYTGDFIVSVESLVPYRLDGADLERALSRLDSMPTDELPEPHDYPAFSVMPMHRNGNFVGRAEELLALAAALKGHRTVALKESAHAEATTPKALEKVKKANQGEAGGPSVAAATGIGGIGKTQLAVEFVHRYGQYFDGGVFWLNFADPATVEEQVVSCGEAGALNLYRKASGISPREKVRRVREAWRSSLPRLLVFDNCEDEKLLRQWLPEVGGCRVLITSRRGRWSSFFGVRLLELDVLKREDSIKLLRKLRADLPSEEYERNTAAFNDIAAELGDLPLALHLAGSYMNTLRHLTKPTEYLGLLRAPPLLGHPSLQRNDELSPTDHEQNVALTFRLSYRLLDPADPTDSLSLKLLPPAAHFAAGEFVPLGLLRDAAGRAGRPLAVFPYAEAVKRLVEVGILTENGPDGALRLHRLLAQFVRQEVGAEADAEAMAKVRNLVKLILWSPHLYGYAQPLSSLNAHLSAVVNETFAFFAGQGQYDDAVYHLLLLDRFRQQWGGYQDSVVKFEQVQDKVTDPHSRAMVLLHLGNAYRSMGRPERAIDYYERALAVSHTHGLKADAAAAMGASGNYFFDAGRLEEARRRYRKAIGLLDTLDKKDRKIAAKWRLNLATCYDGLGFTNRADDELQKALTLLPDIKDESLVKEVRLISDINRARYYFKHGDTRRAVALTAAALEQSRRLDDGRAESICLGNLGDYHTALAEYEQAKGHLADALRLCREVGLKGEEGHILHSMAELLIDEGNYEEASGHASLGVEVGVGVGNPKIASDNGGALARAHLYAGRLGPAHDAAAAAAEHADVLNRDYVLALCGVIELGRGREDDARERFEAAERHAALLTRRDARRYHSHYVRALAASGLALCGLGERVVVAEAACRKARSINSDAGVVRRNARLLSLLSKADDSGLLSEVRSLLGA